MIRGKRCSACRQNGVDDVVLIHRCHITNKNESTSTDSNVVNSQYTLRPPASRVLFSTSQLAQAKTRRDSSNSTITPTARPRSANTPHPRQHNPYPPTPRVPDSTILHAKHHPALLFLHAPRGAPISISISVSIAFSPSFSIPLSKTNLPCYVISIALASAVHLFYVSQFLAIVKVSWARFDA